MAEMIPESISLGLNVTPGEKRVFRILQEALIPDEDNLVWYEPRAIERYPDFILWSQNIGLLVIEVKDWGASQIKEINQKNFKVQFGLKVESRECPLAQARDVSHKMMNVLKKVPSFVHESGDLKGKLRFPVGYCVFFTNITSTEAEKLGIETVLPKGSCIYSDDLSLDTDSAEERRKFVTKVKNTFATRFQFDPLNYEEIKNLRYQLFPEVRVNKVRLRSEEDERLIKTLDRDQERTAKSLGEGHRVLKGVAGSGKTLVLACRAKYLKKLHPDWKILVVCYNISLSRYLKSLVALSGPEQGDTDIGVYHFHGLVKAMTGANLSPNEKEDDKEYDERVGNILKGRIAEGAVQKGMFDAILVDEGQDFTTTWMQGLTQLLNSTVDSLLFCYDPAQNVFGRSKPNWKSAGFKVQGKRPTLLKKSYRNTVEILKLATRFLNIEDLQAEDEEESLNLSLFPDFSTDRHGQKPYIVQCKGDEQIEYIFEKIAALIEQKECAWSDIGILYTARNYLDNLPERFNSAFEKRFGAEKIYWMDSRNKKLELDLASEKVKLSTIESCKGLEFRVVFLVGLESLPRFKDREEAERRLAYVGMTRAQDSLYILYENNVGYILELKNILDLS